MVGDRRKFLCLAAVAATESIDMAGEGSAEAATTPVVPPRSAHLATSAIAGPKDIPGNMVCGNAGGLLAGFWQTSSYGVDGFLWRAGTIRHLPGNSRPIAMSQAGTVVGEITGRYVNQAFRWSRGAHTALPYLGGQDQLGGYMSIAAAVSFLGLVVGCSTTDNGEQHACLWSGSVSRDLGTLGGPRSSAAAVNDLGQVVGTSLTSTGTSRGFVWSDGRMRDVGTLGGGWSNAIGVNNVGHVVGNSETSDGYAHAFWWNKGKITDLGPLDGDQHSEAVAVNSSGQVLVRSYGERVRGFLWANGRRTEILGIEAGSVDPVGLNDDGVVCGTVGLPNGAGHAFRWQRRVLTDLGTLGGPGSAAHAVTATGIVLGEAQEVAALISRPVFWAP